MQAQFQGAAATLATMSLSENCDAFLRQVGISVNDLQAAATTRRFVNGFGPEAQNTRLYQLYAKADPLLAGAAQRDTRLQGTVASVFQNNDRYLADFGQQTRFTSAMAELKGSTIFVDPLYGFSDPLTLVATVAHETIHNLTGLTDEEMAAAWGITLSGGTTGNTVAFRRACF